MIQYKDPFEQAKTSFSQIFSTLRVSQCLRQAGIRKTYGVSWLVVFQMLFQLVFQCRNLFRLLDSKYAESLPGKDVFYRFLNEPGYNWRRFYQLLSGKVVEHFETLTSARRVRVFIVDDTAVSRDRSKKVEMLARVYDHVSKEFIRGFTLLTLGWSDGYSFTPLDFTLMSSAKEKNRYNGMKEGLDKRLSGYKRRQEALLPKPEAVIQMIDRALQKGRNADYLLMDSWFTHMPLVKRILEKGLHVIGRVKELNQRYLYQGEACSLSKLYAAMPKKGKSQILGSVRVKSTTEGGTDLKIVFVRHRNNRKEWLALLTTDTALDETEIVRIYGMRWSIEPFHKVAKSLLKLGKEFEGRSYDMMICHTTLVFTRYLVLEWVKRKNNDDRSCGGMFFLFCDEVKDMDLMTALEQLMFYVFTLISHSPSHDISHDIFCCQVLDWLRQLPCFLKALWPVSLCES